MDLWTFLVIELFQGFWAAIFAVAVMMYIIGILGNLSQYTLLSYISWFAWIMVVGYGYVLFSILITCGMIYLHGVAIPKMINRGNV